MSEREFFKQPLSKQETLDLLAGESPRALFNFKSQTFKASGLDADALSDDDLLDLLAQEPRYFKRPVAVVNGRLIPGAVEKVLAEAL